METRSPKGCGKIYDTIIRSQRQIKRFGSVHPAGGLGFGFYCYGQRGPIVSAANRKHRRRGPGAGPGNLMDSRRCFLRSCLRSQRCQRSWEGGRDFRGRARGGRWLGDRDLWQLILTLSSNPGRLQKAQRNKTRLNRM